MTQTVTFTVEGPRLWTVQDQIFLATHYPAKGLHWCAKALGRKPDAIRSKAHHMGLKLDKSGEFFKDFQRRAAASKVGKKRPEQAAVMLKNHADGKFAYTPERRAENSKRAKAWIAENGHPRGATGMKHTEESKAKMAKGSRDYHANMTDDQVYAKTRKTLEARFERGTYASQRNGVTWKGGWRNIGGVDKYYRSRWEANYARYLEWLKFQGQIAKWEHEPKVFWFDGIKRGCVSYLPDFRVTENDGSEAFHEVKGWMDARSKTKIKRMAKYHPDVTLIVIDKVKYKQIAKQVSALVPEWESEPRAVITIGEAA